MRRCGKNCAPYVRSTRSCWPTLTSASTTSPSLDNRLHRLITTAVPNRFIDDFYDVITLIFHYHYQWNKRDERQRNEVAIGEHLAYIDALLARDRQQVEHACRAHLASARQTLRRAFLSALEEE